jgi:hypothetical protein
VFDVVIMPEGASFRKKSDRQAPKGHVFSGTMMAWVDANALWSGGEKGTEAEHRPVWAVIGCTAGAEEPLKANLRLGRSLLEVTRGPAYAHQGKFQRWEFMASAKWEYRSQRWPERNVTAIQVYQPRLFEVTPRFVDAEKIGFVLLPRAAWIERQGTDEAAVDFVCRMFAKRDVTRSAVEVLLPAARALGHATAFAGALNKHSRAPILRDRRFCLQLIVGALVEGLASVSKETAADSIGYHARIGYVEHGTSALGYAPGVAFSARHADYESFLGREIKTFLNRVK